MIYHEEKLNLFSIDDSYYIAHCISADFALGAGIAKEIDGRFNIRAKLFDKFPNGFEYYLDENDTNGECILIDRVLNLVTKRKYYDKPTYKSMDQALTMMREVCICSNITKIAMPTIGCGLDRLSWNRVRTNIIHQFTGMDDMEILVCML